MSATLADQQQALLRALWQPRHEDALQALGSCVQSAPGAEGTLSERGLRAYRANAQELAQRVLSSVYPVLAVLLGAENFAPLARQFWQQQPPVLGDLSQWGAGLPPFLEALADLSHEEPYLADVARTEWSLHLAASAADVIPDPDSFALLAARDASELTLVLSPGVRCVSSSYPVVSIVNAHLSAEPTLEEAGERLRMQVAECALVWRHGPKPMLALAGRGEASFIAALQENRSLSDSLAAAPELDLPAWLAPAVQAGLISGARLLRQDNS